MAKHFNTRSKESKGLLFIDSEVFNKELPAGTTLADIKDLFQIKGNLRKNADYGNSVEYKLTDSYYSFTIKFL